MPPTHTFQFVECEYMRADKYDAFIADPESFMLRTYMPRVFKNLPGLSMLPTFFGATELPFVPFMMMNYAFPPVQETLQAMMDAAKLTMEWLGANGRAGAVVLGERGLP